MTDSDHPAGTGRFRLIGHSRNLRLAILLLLIAIASTSYSQKVYVTRTGTKYHDDGCRYLAKSKIATTVHEAEFAGYTACSVCKPAKSPVIQQNSGNDAPIRHAVSRQCSGITQAGKRCSRMTKSASGKCWQHE